MSGVVISRHDLLRDPRGKVFADLLNDPEQPFDTILEFFNSESRQRCMVDSEVRYHRAPLAAVERELELQPAIQNFLHSKDADARKRLGQVVTVVVRMIMDRLGWDVVPQAVGSK